MRILVTGAGGQLGAYVLDELATRGFEVVAWGRVPALSRSGQEIEGLDFEAEGWEERLEVVSPDVVMHLAALSAAEAVRKDPERGRWINVDTTRRLAEWCDRRGRGLVFTSTDLVFAGTKPFSREDDPAEPVLAYGRTKREAEPFVLATPRGLVARVSLLYGFSRSGRDAYFDRTIAALLRGEPQSLFEDEFRTPLDLGSAASALIGLAEAGATGIVHVAGRERMSRFDLIRRAAVVLGIDPSLVRANRCAEAVFPEPRPADVSLDTERLAALLPDLQRPTIEEVLRAHVPVL
jgi:dTDP-4-dehydrorhamnose reductase